MTVIACITIVVTHLCTPSWFTSRNGSYELCTVDPMPVPDALAKLSWFKGQAENCGFKTKDFKFKKPGDK